MKSNELTMGAWVQEYLPIPDKLAMPMQVVGILSDNIAYLDFGGNVGDVFEAEVENLRGIPLTKEILQKNGFIYDEKQRYWYDEANEIFITYYKHFCVLEVLKEQHARFRFKTEIPFVHHLQQVIGFCGIEKRIKL